MRTTDWMPAGRMQSTWRLGLTSVALAASLGSPIAATAKLSGLVVKPAVAIPQNWSLFVLSPYKLSAGSLDFGPTAVGTQKVLNLQIANNSDEILSIGDIKCEGGAFAASPGLMERPTILGYTFPGIQPVMMVHVGGSNSFLVSFSPTARGGESGMLSFTVYAPGDKQYPVRVPLSGNGAVAQGQMNVTRLDFGEQAIFTPSEPRTVTFTNTGSVTGEYKVRQFGRLNHFKVDLPDKITIPAGGSSSFPVRFAPQFPGQQSASVVFEETRSGELLTLPLTGAGVAAGQPPVTDFPAPAVEVSRLLVDFGTAVPGTVAQQWLTITNRGSAVVTISALEMAGLDRSEFSLTVGQNLPWVLMPQESRTVLLRFAPGGMGARAATLLITHDGAEGSSVVTLMGAGGNVAQPPAGDAPAEG